LSAVAVLRRPNRSSSSLTRGAQLAVVVEQVNPAAILARQSDHDVNVVLPVAHRKPPARAVITWASKARLGQTLAGRLRPLRVRQDAVLRSCPQRQVIDELLRRERVSVHRLPHQRAESTNGMLARR